MTLSKGSLEVLRSVHDGSATFWFYWRNRNVYRELAKDGFVKLTRGLFVDTWEITDAGRRAMGVAEPELDFDHSPITCPHCHTPQRMNEMHKCVQHPPE